MRERDAAILKAASAREMGYRNKSCLQFGLRCGPRVVVAIKSG